MQTNIQHLIDILISKMGYKKYELGVEEFQGVYFITLPTYSLSILDMTKLCNILSEGSLIGIYPNVFSGLSIKTTIKVK